IRLAVSLVVRLAVSLVVRFAVGLVVGFFRGFLRRLCRRFLRRLFRLLFGDLACCCLCRFLRHLFFGSVADVVLLIGRHGHLLWVLMVVRSVIWSSEHGCGPPAGCRPRRGRTRRPTLRGQMRSAPRRPGSPSAPPGSAG